MEQKLTMTEYSEQDKVDPTITSFGDKMIGELPPLDLNRFMGQKVKVASVTEHEGTSFNNADEPSYYIKIVTEPIEGNWVARKTFSLKKTAEGNIGWTKDGMLGTFLFKMDAKHYNELVGKEVIVVVETSKKTGKDYLTLKA